MTLIEIAFAVVIVAIGVTAIMGFFGTASKSNSQLGELHTGIILATSAHNWANNQHYYTYTDPNTNVLVPGIESWVTTLPTGPAIQSDLVAQGWTQAFAVQRVQTTNIQANSTNTDDKCLRVTVTISKGGRKIYTLSRLYAPGFR